MCFQDLLIITQKKRKAEEEYEKLLSYILPKTKLSFIQCTVGSRVVYSLAPGSGLVKPTPLLHKEEPDKEEMLLINGCSVFLYPPLSPFTKPCG